ncbi:MULTISPECIES: exopolysaccharide biosynthesis polyprenyl glycosylphosphotransferase [Myroides]|uniref:Exopolysaccharide biosynthesis polyprenyl glycosylphosphotransferase n=1 Tax=Myroides albus TaxID=2562892 RepID=A0A6I3LFK0_9FLAO|nr:MULTISPECIES: exopolysaccharide biosynthesis polyprenyl glycosylphosphotransferase [Myroides]MTG96574.1 exopolysaccharide biosynthesis polyprenyl glycosylphosphotransferase [Myroides albus]MVX34570.1 exopolysaccharide biosynthesis polyprenyl glycosylphosphotransferase [Myroides sp. LoEW2-1]UVD81012.1 exopolysaccharide biosynthesis polyprenyl glycosylphosphotransferase [Myroides albus]
MAKNSGRYSYLIRPLTISLDLILINVLATLTFDIPNAWLFHVFLSVGWIISAWISNFYDVYRHTRVVRILEKVVKQFALQFVVVTSFNGFFERFAEPMTLITYGVLIVITVTFSKFLIFFSLKYFRKVLGGNSRNIILIGEGKEISRLAKVFHKRKDLGFRILGVYSDYLSDSKLDEIKTFILAHEVDEIYVQFSIVQDEDYHELLEFADSNLIKLQYVPTQKQVLTHSLKVIYYDIVPVLPRRVIPLDKPYNKLFKRLFDLVFSLGVIVFILSWLVPIIAVLIKRESKGPVFFKQKRTGINDEEFYCYKFRSMAVNDDSDKKQATKNDSRITKIGAFLRKSSLDEFPQFLNVFLGDMSIVGPRPHMVVHTKVYAKRVNKFMLRHLVKPGITGMAQTHGYRGEIETDRDIINRFKYDLFYLENWSIFLDLKIIYLTVYNVFKGEEKAY